MRYLSAAGSFAMERTRGSPIEVNRNLLLDYLSRVFVIAERHKPRMTKPISLSPFQEVDNGHKLRAHPNAFFHLLGV
jgi:hypothetical protein